MASIKPFAALRPRPELAARICELPYDVMSSDEARALAKDNPLSFLRVSKPEIDLPAGTDLYSKEVYAKGRENLERLVRDGSLAMDAGPRFYLYRQVMGGHQQVGLVAAASCEEYGKSLIKKHELTRPDKEDDRVRHIETLEAQTGPVFLTYRAAPALDAFVAQKVTGAPAIDFVAPDGVRHSAWIVSEPADLAFIEQQFEAISALYIADGHHRSAAAYRVYQSRQGAGQSGRFLAVIFPHNQLQILPYNRVLKDLNGRTPEELREKLASVFEVVPPGGQDQPRQKHEVAFYMGGQWQTLRFKAALTKVANPIDGLDVTLLQNHVLAPWFGIDDPRTSQRIQFVGGIRGAGELKRMVDSGAYACAFGLYPTGIDDLISIADAGGIMPPKSTWFEPKLRDAMFCHRL